MMHRTFPAYRAGTRRSARRFPVLSACVLLAVIACCILISIISGGDPARMDPTAANLAPCTEHPFGTDSLGRDLWSMIWPGGLRSLFIGAAATLISTVIAVVYGTVSGLAGDTADSLMMRFTEILLSIPSLLLIVFLQAAVRQSHVAGIAVVIGVTGWMSMAKMVRTEVRRLRSSDFVVISRMMGGSFLHVLGKHLFPNFLGTIMFMIVMNIRSAIIAESTLSFLGIGLPPEIITWGSMLSLAERALLTGSWWIILIPGAFLVITLLCITELGEYLRAGGRRLHGNL